MVEGGTAVSDAVAVGVVVGGAVVVANGVSVGEGGEGELVVCGIGAASRVVGTGV